MQVLQAVKVILDLQDLQVATLAAEVSTVPQRMLAILVAQAQMGTQAVRVCLVTQDLQAAAAPTAQLE
jgi:hypothetical protein